MDLESKVYKTVTAIPNTYWENLDCSDNRYYSPAFLNAFESANTAIEFNYIFILKANKAVAFAYIQVVSIGVKTITKNIKMMPKIRRIINTSFCSSNIRVLFCGNVFLSGEYGTFLKEGEPKTETFIAIAKAVKKVAKNTKKLNALFVKDFKTESLQITNQLKDFDYAAMQVEPNMIITLQPEWHTFEDYKSTLKSKYRVKANRADAKSEALTTKLFSEVEILKYKNELQALYQNTIENADFNAQILNLETYVHLKKNFKKHFFVKGYFLNNTLVGFLSAMKNGDNLDAHFIGIDYDKNKQYAVYPRILNDYLRLGITTQAKTINLGRTAAEIKSTLGAQPEALTCYCKHKRYVPNQILKPFIKNVSIKSFKQHNVFK